MDFSARVQHLPRLGLGVSTEYGAGGGGRGLDPLALRRDHPDFAAFLEVGVETARGLDEASKAWIDGGNPVTYHFLDLNLDEAEDMDVGWLAQVQALAARMHPAWICGDAGLWHFGRRERGHMLLLPPILTDDSAWALAEGIVRLREATGLEVIPENPPGTAFVGDLHMLDFFSRVAERADTGLLLDCAHLAIYQRMTGREPLDGLADLDPWRVVEMHVAGGTVQDAHGLSWVDDDHTTAVLDDTWAVLDAVAPLATNLKAVVFECERNSLIDTLGGFERIRRAMARGQAPA
jgi:uncharacterized protein (UPF0276 family)